MERLKFEFGILEAFFKVFAGDLEGVEAQSLRVDIGIEYHELQFFEGFDDEEVLDDLPVVFLGDSALPKVLDEVPSLGAFEFVCLGDFAVGILGDAVR